MGVPQSLDSALAHELSLAATTGARFGAGIRCVRRSEASYSFLVSTKQRECLRVSIPIKIRNRDAE
jgi:hypothetical protein